jgi:hypothetical protein
VSVMTTLEILLTSLTLLINLVKELDNTPLIFYVTGENDPEEEGWGCIEYSSAGKNTRVIWWGMICLPTTSVENERTFSLMNLIKTCLRNRTGPQLLEDLCRIQRSEYELKTFPYEKIYAVWMMKERYGVNAWINQLHAARRDIDGTYLLAAY